MTTLDELKERAAAKYERGKERKRETYAYARHLGFSSQEAELLSGWSKRRIEGLARQRAD